MVYCKSDEAYLCLSCDQNIHSANALSKCHSRTLVCDNAIRNRQLFDVYKM
ncbi:putative transcription factor interactor and regulator Znf-B family [Helianthus anomalus]